MPSTEKEHQSGAPPCEPHLRAALLPSEEPPGGSSFVRCHKFIHEDRRSTMSRFLVEGSRGDQMMPARLTRVIRPIRSAPRLVRGRCTPSNAASWLPRLMPIAIVALLIAAPAAARAQEG